jgi:hypothetical protein
MTTSRCLVLLLSVGSAAFAHRSLCAAIPAHRASMVFSFECATPAQLPTSTLARAVRSALAEVRDPGVTTWGDRAVAQDLNGDGQPEYLVPLRCGATGNCTWGVFSIGPARHLGMVLGARVQVSFPNAGWAKVVGYSSLGSGQGLTQGFELRGGRYVEIERHEVAGADNDQLLDSMGDPKCESK